MLEMEPFVLLASLPYFLRIFRVKNLLFWSVEGPFGGRKG